MASVHNPELRDALASAGSGDSKALAAAESVSREIRQSRESAVEEAESAREVHSDRLEEKLERVILELAEIRRILFTHSEALAGHSEALARVKWEMKAIFGAGVLVSIAALKYILF